MRQRQIAVRPAPVAAIRRRTAALLDYVDAHPDIRIAVTERLQRFPATLRLIRRVLTATGLITAAARSTHAEHWPIASTLHDLSEDARQIHQLLRAAVHTPSDGKP